MFQPDELKKDEPLLWSVGRGTDVWALLSACAVGDLPRVRSLLKREPSLVRCHYCYRTPIYFAVRENRLELAQFLLDHGADPLSLAVNDTLLEITRDRGYTEMEQLLEEHHRRQFHYDERVERVAESIRAYDTEKVLAMLEAGPELIRCADRGSNQPFHWAVMTRQLALMDSLLDRGADINARRFDGARPIHLTNGDYHYRGWRDVPSHVATTPDEVWSHLVTRGAEVDLGMAAAKGDIDRARKLLAEDPSSANRVSDYGSYYIGCGAPIKNAAATGQMEIVKLLLEHGADPNLPEEGIAPRGHALYSAVSKGHYEIAELLLKHGACPSAPVESSADALSIALSHGDKRMVELLCTHGAARSVELLAHYNDLQTAAAIFAVKPELANDANALGSAASMEFVRLMLLHQPDLPKHVTLSKSPEINELLFRHGMDPSRPDWMGITRLHEFARQGQIEAAKQFIDHGADLHARDDDLRSTPLAWAAKFGQKEMVELLLERGARSQLPDDPPWATPLAWATRRGHHEIAALLEGQATR